MKTDAITIAQLNGPAETCFTAAQFAAALGRTRQAVAQRLAAIHDSTQIIVNGNTARAWPLPALPVDMQCDLAAAAARSGHTDAAAMLTGPAPVWYPRAPLAQIEQAAWDKAVKLKAVLEPFLIATASQQRSQAELETDGAAQYQRIFGHRISGRWFRALLNRTLERDGNLKDFSRLKLYLDEDAGTKTKPHRKAIAALPDTMADMVKTLDDPADPTSRDRVFLFDGAFSHLQGNADKESLIDSLFAAVPTMAKNKKAFRKMFNRKYAAWLEAGGDMAALEDRRPLASGKFRKADFKADEEKIRNEAIRHDGSIALAYRKLRQAGQLSVEFCDHYHFNPRHNKSYVPGKVRDSITNEVKMCGPIHHGPWKAKMSGPYIPRDWSDTQVADWISADDFTLNHVFRNHFQDIGLQLHRGECLIFIDLRTGYVLDYLLIAGHYNSRHIRKLILRIHDKFGLPWIGWYFERSVWASRIIRDLDSRENFQWRETETGLAAFGLQVRHATTPRAKTIEGLGRIWQERQRPEPGFVGFDERRDEREPMQDYLARVRRGTANAQDKLLSMERWSGRLDEIFREYNNDPQNGKMLKGQSPAEAWQAGLERRPLRQLPQDARYLLSTHCIPVKVKQQGIVLTIGQNKMLFCNERTGQLIGQNMLAFYNLDCPELLTVSDLNRQNYFTVKNISLPAMTATKEQFATVHTAIAGHRKAAKIIYGNIQRQSAHTITRDDDVSEKDKELGRFHNAEVTRHQAEETNRVRNTETVARRAAAAGLVLSQPVRDLDDAGDAIDRLAAIRAKRSARQAPVENHQGKAP